MLAPPLSPLSQKMVSKGLRGNGIYRLENQEFLALYSNRQHGASKLTWHHRLGHLNHHILQQLKSSNDISVNKSSTFLICEPCQMGKSSKLQLFLLRLVLYIP